MKLIEKHFNKLNIPLAGQFGLRIFLLLLLCILPSYELVKTRFANTVTTADTEVSRLELEDGDVVSQEVYVGSGTHLTQFSIGMESALDNENASVVVTVKQGDISESEHLTRDEIPSSGLYELKDIDFSKYSDGSVVIDVSLEESYGGTFALQMTKEDIYGYDAAQKNGVPQDGSLVISFSSWSLQNECVIYSIAWIFVILMLIIMASWLMTYKAEWKHFDKVIRALTFGLIISVFSLLYPSFLWYGCDWCEGIFYYRKIQENSLLDVLLSSDFDLYMAQYNNIFMYLIVKVFGIDTYTFVVCQILSIGMVAYWASLFCKKQYGKYFPIDFRVGAAIVSICYLYTMQEFSFIGIAYFGVLFLLYIITYDFSEDRVSFWLSIPMIIIMCMSKMTFVLFCPIGIFLLYLWRKKISKRNRILLWVMTISCLLEGLVSVLLNGGLNGGTSLGTIQDVSLLKLITGSLYYMVQLANSVVFHEMNFANALLINVLMSAILVGMLLWCVREVFGKRRFEKAAGFIIAMLAAAYGNCALQLLTNSYSMTPGNIHWDQIFYLPVLDKWWWYSFGYVALWAAGLTWIYIFTAYCKENILTEHEMGKNWYRQGSMIVSLVLCIVTVNQYAYHGEDFQSYKAANMFTVPSMMEGNFTEYSFMQKDDQFLIVTSFEPTGLDWYYIHNADYATMELDERCQRIDFSEGYAQVGVIAMYVHKSDFTNQMKDGRYKIRLYGKDKKEIACYEQLDEDNHREYICFYFGGEKIDGIAYATFEYEDGSRAYIDDCVRIGYCK